MSGDFTVKVQIPQMTCPQCGADSRTITPFVSRDAVRIVYRCGSNHQYEQTVPIDSAQSGGGGNVAVRAIAHNFDEAAGLSAPGTPNALEVHFRIDHERSTERSESEIESESRALRRYTEEPAGPLEVLVMCLARELHDAEHADCDWFGHVGSTVSSFCRRACETRGINWKWVQEAITRERSEDFYTDIR